MRRAFKTLFDLPRAVVQSARMISDFRPDVMIGVGGYASGPAMLAGGLMNLPMLAFEPNVIPGIANRLVAPMVKRSGGTLPGNAALFPQCRRHWRSCTT